MFLVLNSKTLFLINNQEAQVGKINIFLEQSVGANNDVYLASFHFFQNAFLFSRASKSG